MIIWLASYPRSGNSLCRRFLYSVFEHSTFSKHNSDILHRENADTVEVLGHDRWLDASWPEAYARMKNSPELFFVKTHEPPEDNGKAIYIVRDGRMSSVSYSYYLQDFSSVVIPLWDIITGFVTYGSWGSHLAAWDPQQRPDTLLLHYENMVQSPEECIERIAAFSGLFAQHKWKNDFDDLHQFHSNFFRRGKTKFDEKEMPALEQDLFWWLHGQWMIRLGYATESPVRITPEQELAKRLCCEIAEKSTEFFQVLQEKERVIQNLSRATTLRKEPERVCRIVKKIMHFLGKRHS